MSAQFFSLAFSESHVAVADASAAGAGVNVSQLGFLEIDPTIFRSDHEATLDQQADKIAKLLSQLRISKKNVNVVLPDAVTYNQVVEMPRLNDRELLSSIRYLADQFIPMPLDEINLDVEELYEDKEQKKINALIAAAPKKVIERVDRVIRGAGLIAESVETEISAIGRYLSHVLKKQANKPSSAYVFVNMDLTTCSLYFYEEERGLITVSHYFRSGYSLFLKEITINLNIDTKKAAELLATFGAAKGGSYDLTTILSPVVKDFMGELQRFIGRVQEERKSKVSAIYFTNEIVHFPSLLTVVERYFTLPTHLFDPTPTLSQNTVVATYKALLPYFLPALGANLR